MLIRGAALAVLLLGVVAARAAELPIIVTYELQRQSEAVHDARTDPRAFWIRQIVARIEDAKSAASLGLKQPATVRVRFVVGRDGKLASRELETSSGVSSVDDAALAMLVRAQPFPPMPETLTENSLAFTLPLRFR